MLFNPYEIELLKGAIQMFDLRPEPFNDSKDTHRKLSSSCSYKLTHLNNLTCFTEDEIEFLTCAMYYSLGSDSVTMDEDVWEDLNELIWKLPSFE